MGGFPVTTIKLKYVQTLTDRHGAAATISGAPANSYAPRTPGSREFMAAYEASLAETGRTTRRPARNVRSKGTFAHLAALYFASANFHGLSLTSRRNYRRIIDGFVREHGHRRVDQFKREHAVKIVGDMSDRPGAAITLLSGCGRWCASPSNSAGFRRSDTARPLVPVE